MQKQIDSIFVVLGATFGLVNIQTLLGVLLLTLQIVWLIGKGFIKIKEALKNKEYDKALDIIKETKESLEVLKDDDKK